MNKLGPAISFFALLAFSLYALSFPSVIRHYLGDACGPLPPVVRYFYEPLRLSGATHFGYYLDSWLFDQPQGEASVPP